MCVDFTDLNKACSKDSFPLPKIDQLVDSTTDHGLLNFMDAFLSYNQILMFEHDEELFFGLKNAGATYQRLVNKIFKPLIEKTMEVYMNDMIIKFKYPVKHMIHLKETFEPLRKYKMKFNPEKCVFGVSSRNFLGFISHRGIKANPEKIRAVIEIKSPYTLKDI